MTARQEDLFGGAVTPTVLANTRPPASDDSAGVRRTKRQIADVAAGRHPLTGGGLNPKAPADARDKQAVGLRCGSCVHRIFQSGHGKTWPKCDAYGAAYLTHGAATDVRAWWPACGRHTPHTT